MKCPLCDSIRNKLFDIDQFRSFLLCGNCSLVFVPRDQLINDVAEKKRYESHHNSENNSEYKKYLQKIADNVSPFLNKNSVGLDFGCGKTRIIENYLKRQGFEVFSYDLFFHPDYSVFERRYHFIILSEVIEHLRNPFDEMKRLTSLLHDNGLIFIKTKLRSEDANEFKNWFYKRDITHIQFFSELSFFHLGQYCGLSRPLKLEDDLILFRNNI